MAARTIYSGSKRKLVLAFDLGTTYSGISYSILDPGQVPIVKGVTKFPAQETISGASKIPTVIYYDRAGKVQAVGAETQTDEAYEKAEDENWVKAEWFKLHLRSKYGKGGDITERIPPLPLNKSVVEVIADFLRYLRKCAESYIRETHANGPQLWSSVENEIDYVLSHPNGWEGSEQTRMRQAAVLAGLAPDTSEGHSRITFVTEGEASLHFAVQNGISSEGLQTGNGVIIVDAGGGTVDISTYRKNVEAGDTNAFEEIAAAQCHFHGSVFVSILARLFLEKLLAESRFCDDIEHLVRCFDRTTKPRFRNDQEPQYIKFGTTRDNDPGCGIRYGQLKLNGPDVGSFFTPAIECIVEAVNVTQKASPRRISHVVLVGGFSASDWLYQNVHDRLVAKGLTVVRPDNHVNKAVSDGAISFYLDHFVRTRVSKMTYGVICRAIYDPNKPDHVAREHTIIHSVSGDKLVPGWFFRILPRDTQVKETKEFRQSLSKEETSMEHFKELLLSIYCYRGENPDPQWKDVDTANYTVLCTISTDLSNYPAKPQTAANGKTYYEVDYDIVLSFGLTELKAQVAWKENGVEKRGPARVLYDPDDSRDTP